MVEVLEDPYVPAVDAQGPGVLAQSQVGGDGGAPLPDPSDALARGRRGLADRAIGGQEAVERRFRAGVGDDDGRAVDDLRRPGAPVVADPHADGGALLGEDLDDLLGDADRAAGPLDTLLDRAGDARAASPREPRALEVVADDEGMDGEGAARWRQAVVAPLAGEEGAQARVGEAPPEVVPGGARGQAPGEPLGGSQQRGRGPGHHPSGESKFHPSAHAPDVAEVAVDGAGLIGEGPDEGALVATLP